MEALDSFWQRAISDTEPCLTLEIILAGREQLCEKFEQWAEGSHQILRLKADTREEALLLLAAWARQEGGPAEQFLFANAIIVHSEEAWRQATCSNRPLILIPLLDGGALGLGEAKDRGHRIVVPSGWEAPERQEIIVTPWLDRQRLQVALVEAGLDQIQADRVAANCGRSLQVLMRQLAKAPERRTPAWATYEEAQALVPLLFAGRWRCNRQGDRAVIANLAGCSYEEAERNVSRWLNEPDPPVRRYGDVLLLTSPADAWHQLGRHVSQQAWERYREVLTIVLNRPDPALDLPPDQRWAASLHGKEHPESDILLEGLLEQLARLVGAEDRIGLSFNPSPASVAQRVLQACLSPADDVERWFSIKEHMPDLAEAAPTLWLDSLERLLANDRAAASLFEEAGLFSTSPQVFIMFAIERLRWFPQHLRRCAEALVRLSAVDPGHNSWPRPSSVFGETFCLFKPENNVPFEDQFTILKSLAAGHPQSIWPLLVTLLPKDRCRTVNYGPRFHEPIQQLINFLVDLAGEQSARWIELIKDVHRLPPAARSIVISSLAEAAPQLKNEQQATEFYYELIQLVRRHRRHAGHYWALPSAEIDRVEEFARTLQPADPVDVHSWLFRKPWLHIDLECSRESLREMQLAAVRDVLAAGGVKALARLASKTSHPGLIGRAAAAAVGTDEGRRSLLAFLLDRADDRSHTIVRGCVEELFKDQGLPVSDFVAKYACGIDGRSFGVFAQGLPVGSETWDAVEARRKGADAAYWKSDIFLGQDEPEIERAVRAMLRHNEVTSAAEHIAYSICTVSSELVLETLKRIRAFLNDSAHMQNLDRLRYSAERMFELLGQNGDVLNQQLVRLEIGFFPFLQHTKRGFPNIVQHVRENPEFFVELLRLRFERSDGQKDAHLEELSEERRKQLFDIAFHILHEFDAIPGLEGTGPEAVQHMRSWINQVLDAAAQ